MSLSDLAPLLFTLELLLTWQYLYHNVSDKGTLWERGTRGKRGTWLKGCEGIIGGREYSGERGRGRTWWEREEGKLVEKDIKQSYELEPQFL